ncbi:unnamed protein product [Mytilus edulis]|uniref:Uncharacterized protein n=1 Tax=Mytilus edulis TaxID=6550 RepID=A0A8S3TG67_MYTED|nr:unnamed protein product [Mytilus edulis]
MSSDLDSSNKEVILSFAQQERRLEKVEKEYDKVDEELQYAKEKINQLQESKDNTKGNVWPLILSAYSDCNMIFTFLEKERLKRMNCEQVSETESEVGGALRNVFFDTQISFDEYDNEASHELSSSNGPLLTVVTWERVDLMQCLLQSYKVGNINETFTIGVKKFTPLLFAYDNGQFEIAKMLVKFLLLNKENDSKETPLFLACRFGHTECVKLLVEGQCDVNCIDTEGKSPLLIACADENADIVEILLNANYCKIDHCDNLKNNALTISCELCNTEIAHL